VCAYVFENVPLITWNRGAGKISSDGCKRDSSSGSDGAVKPSVGTHRGGLPADRRARRVTIREIADAAGVSVSTVSHVLNEYGDIGPDTERRVRQVMKEMNYYPSSLARRLVKKRSYLFQLLLFSVEGLHHPFFYEVTCGITDEVEKAGYDLLLGVKDSDDRRWRDSLRRCYESKVEGIIVMGTLPGPELFEEIRAGGIPTVFIDIPYKGPRATYVTSDNVRGARMATEHLISLGHRKIAFLDGHYMHLPAELQSQEEPSRSQHAPDNPITLWGISEARREGYAEALDAHDIPLDTGLILHGDYTKAGAKEAVLGMLDNHLDVTAIFAISDVMAIGAMQAVRESGRKVPKDVAVVGYDDIESASYVRPALSTVKQHGEEMGRSAVRQILKLISNPGETPDKVTLPVELVVRESCGGVRGL
jgi:LacI family transcriptional regulator